MIQYSTKKNLLVIVIQKAQLLLQSDH